MSLSITQRKAILRSSKSHFQRAPLLNFLYPRFASSKTRADGKPITLEKPDKYRPPSHPQRLPRPRPREYGPATTQTQKQEMKTKQYPHMMPPEGSFMHWFLTNKWIHVWITLGVLTSLAGYVVLTDFLIKTPYRDLLPPRSDFLSHPISFLSQWITVYKMHVNWNSEQVANRRQKALEDVQKQKEYRKAHGMSEEPNFLGKLTGQQIGEEERPRKQTEEAVEQMIAAGQEQSIDGQAHVDIEESKKKPTVKRWFGIWA